MNIQKGNTITLSCTFKNLDGEVETPDLVKLKFYDKSYQLEEEIVLGESHRMEEGKYRYYYTPTETKRIIYEWYAEYAGKPILKRDAFHVSFL